MVAPSRLTFILAGLMATQATLGLARPELYRDADWIRATWWGNDWVTLLAAVPLLLGNVRSASRGSARAFLLWAGGVGYAIYNYAFYLLGAALNAFLPLYVAAVVLAAIILIVTLGQLDARSIASGLSEGASLRLIGGIFVFIGTGLASVWTLIWAAHVFAGRPTPVEPDAFRLVAALDLSLMVPALVGGGLLLWRRRPWGPVVGAIAGVQATLYLLVLTVNALTAIARGLSASPGELVIWMPLGVTTGAATALLLRVVPAGSASRLTGGTA